MPLRAIKSNVDNEGRNEYLSFNHQQEDQSDEKETKDEEKGYPSESDDDTTKPRSVTAASNPTKNDF